MRRAALAAEFALAQWLVRGVDRRDEAMVAEAEAMLRELEAGIRAAEEAERAAAEAKQAAGGDDEAETGVLPVVPPAGASTAAAQDGPDVPRTHGSHPA